MRFSLAYSVHIEIDVYLYRSVYHTDSGTNNFLKCT